VRLEHTLVVARPPEEVFAFLADPDNLPRWQTGVVEVRREGDRRHVEVRSFLGRRLEQTLVVTEYDPPRRLDLAVVEGPLPLRISHTLEAEDGGTRILFVGEGEPRGLPRLLAGVAAKAVELQSQHDFAKLKRILEGGEE
jgi:uncharacterized protein YndB with AHSA1/START domain